MFVVLQSSALSMSTSVQSNMLGKMEVLKADPRNDIDAIFELVNLAYSVEIGCEGEGFKNQNRYTCKAEVETDIGNTWVIKDKNGKIVASMCLTMKDDIGYLGPVAVRPEYQGKGIGKTLVHFAESRAPKIRLRVVTCRSFLKDMYEKLGYKIVDQYPASNFINKDHMTRYVETIEMEKESTIFKKEDLSSK